MLVGDDPLTPLQQSFLPQTARRPIPYRSFPGNGTVRWVATIGNVSLPPSRNTYSGEATPGDPYEGELFTWLLDLKAEWSSNDEREMPWVAKRAMLVAVNYTAK